MAATGPEYDGILTPGWFQRESMAVFRQLELRPTDIILCSYPKTGTTWLHKVVNLLKRVDSSGTMPADSDVNSDGQVYPDAVPLHRPETPGKPFGYANMDDILAQRDPRIFSTHMPPHLLPDLKHSGARIVYIARNPKDTLTSLHFFFGAAKDDWLGNEHGPGSMNRFLSEPAVNAYGSYWDHILSMERLVPELQPEQVLVMYYEKMKENSTVSIEQLAAFLRLPLTKEKLSTVVRESSFGAMRSQAEMSSNPAKLALSRKGIIGDWQSHLDTDTWSRVDAVFDEKCGGSLIYAPLRAYMVPSSAQAQKL